MGPLPPARLKSLVGGKSMDAEGVMSRRGLGMKRRLVMAEERVGGEEG